ncbi:MAG: hypothetical protein ACC726_08655, partial [Chloroflexota bacterium]
MMLLRATLAAPLRLAAVDLLAAVSIAVILLSLIAGPVLSQDTSPSLLPTATANPTTEAQPSPTGQSGVAPAVTAGPTAGPSPGATPSHSLPPGANSEADPCAPKPTPEPGVTPDPEA